MGTIPFQGAGVSLRLTGSEGQTYDVRDRAHQKQLPREQSWAALTGSPAGHSLHRDTNSIWVADTMPFVVFTETPDPLHLTVLTRGDITLHTQYQHDNVRPRAKQYVPRKKGESLGGPMRPGEVLLGEGETNEEVTCSGANGAFSTWNMAGFERGVPIKQLHTLQPVTGKALSENPAANGLGCSGHWFTQKEGRNGNLLVAAAW